MYINRSLKSNQHKQTLSEMIIFFQICTYLKQTHKQTNKQTNRRTQYTLSSTHTSTRAHKYTHSHRQTLFSDTFRLKTRVVTTEPRRGFVDRSINPLGERWWWAAGAVWWAESCMVGGKMCDGRKEAV